MQTNDVTAQRQSKTENKLMDEIYSPLIFLLLQKPSPALHSTPWHHSKGQDWLF